jgi:phenol 2-monooxygenase
VAQSIARGEAPDSAVDLRAVFQHGHRALDLAAMPALLLPRKGVHGLIDYEKIFCADPRHDIYDLRGIDRAKGALVVVRPDQFVAGVFALGDVAEVTRFLAYPLQSGSRVQSVA